MVGVMSSYEVIASYNNDHHTCPFLFNSHKTYETTLIHSFYVYFLL